MNDDTPLLILLLLCSWFASLILASRLMIVIFQLISSHKKECSVSEKQKICMIIRTLIKEKQQTFPERMNWKYWILVTHAWKNSSFWFLSQHQFLGYCLLQSACDVTISLQLDVLPGMVDDVQLMQDGLPDKSQKKKSIYKLHLLNSAFIYFQNEWKLPTCIQKGEKKKKGRNYRSVKALSCIFILAKVSWCYSINYKFVYFFLSPDYYLLTLQTSTRHSSKIWTKYRQNLYHSYENVHGRMSPL